MSNDPFESVVITVTLSDRKLAEVRRVFKNVFYHPDGKVPEEHLALVDIWYTSWLGLPKDIKTISQIPRTRIVQLSSGPPHDHCHHPFVQAG